MLFEVTVYPIKRVHTNDIVSYMLLAGDGSDTRSGSVFFQAKHVDHPNSTSRPRCAYHRHNKPRVYWAVKGPSRAFNREQWLSDTRIN